MSVFFLFSVVFMATDLHAYLYYAYLYIHVYDVSEVAHRLSSCLRESVTSSFCSISDISVNQIGIAENIPQLCPEILGLSNALLVA